MVTGSCNGGRLVSRTALPDPDEGKIMNRATTLAGIVLALGLQSSYAQGTLLLRQPALSVDHLAFVYAGDIWIADRDGSNPRRLTSHPATEDNPTFSPDGMMLAFSASYENNRDVYVIPIEGGQPRRLTWHPGTDVPTGWTADGRAVTFISRRETENGRSGQLYHAALEGGYPTKRMEARIYNGVYDANDERLAYIPFGPAYNGLFGGSSGWKGYRGGTTPPILIMDIRAGAVTTVPGGGATNFDPIWLGDALYYISDRDRGRFNVYRYDPSTGRIVRVSNEAVWDVRSADGDGSTIVYEAGGRLKRLDVASGRTAEIPIEIHPDLPQLRTQWKDVSGNIESAGISPTGKRAIVTARGEVFTVPVDEGSTRNVTGTGSAREYTGVWSPDGDRIAYIEDTDGVQSLVIVDQTGMGEATRHELGPDFYTLMAWAPGDDGRIVFGNNHLTLYAIDPDRGRITTIATGTRRARVDVAVSPDGRWLAYTIDRPNFLRDLVLYELETGDSMTVTDGRADVAAPAFSADGRYLYFAASTDSGPTRVDLNMTSQERPYRAGLYAVVLAADGESPMLPGTGDENADEDNESQAAGEDDNGDDDEDADDDDATAPVNIDFEGLSDRIVALPVAERNYGNLAVAGDGDLYYVQYVQPGTSNEPPGDNAADANELWRFDHEDKEAVSVLSGVNGFSLAADGKHMILRKSDGSLAVAEIADLFEPEALKLDGVRVRVDPRVEWAQIFDDVWRMEKEYFYDPNLHGLDWQAVHARYRPLVDYLGRREDLSELMVEMIGEMEVGHNRTGGGDVYRGEGANTGLLGANFTIDDNRYRLARVYTGESWNPFIEAPLATPGNEAHAGEYILAVDGQDLTGGDNIFEFLQGAAGKQVTLTVGPSADGRDAREIVVEPVDSESQLRLWRWMEDNRRFVDEMTNGRVGYVYLPDTGDEGYTLFNRMFFAQVDKGAMIIDERSNSGGQAANYITEILSRRHLSGWKDRDGKTYNTPAGAMYGPKVMLIDQDAGSGGDYLPYAFRQLGVGKLIGKRTWGGLIGISANPPLVDGGALSVPFFRFFDAAGNWNIENEGVAPDIEVALDPIATNEGRDTQLEAAIADVMSQLEDFEYPIPTEAPPYPTELGR
jgi:tricorn protease